MGRFRLRPIKSLYWKIGTAYVAGEAVLTTKGCAVLLAPLDSAH